ncbi:hypothetical protein AKO1_012785 [Acrasis kona]|uniref:Uncharacterized protein n=1 Tax=Acrasis kona TaxID=1008807 RepID=A0AAW2YX51_9EUKA
MSSKNKVPGAKAPEIINGVTIIRPKVRGAYLTAQAMSATSGFLIFLGGVTLLVGSCISLNGDFYITSGVLWIIGYSLFALAAIFGALTGLGLANKYSRSPLQLIHIFGNMIFFSGSIVMIVGTSLWFAGVQRFFTYNSATILWVIGSSLNLLYFAVRNYGSVLDSLFLYHSYCKNVDPDNKQDVISQEVSPTDHIVGIYVNGIVSIAYTVASVLLLIGSISWLSFLRNAETEHFRTQAGVLWVVSDSIFLFGGLLQMIARR